MIQSPLPLTRSFLRAAALLAAIAALCSGYAMAVEPNIYLAPSIWRSDLTGDGTTGEGLTSEQFDLENTFDLNTGDSVRAFEGFWRLGKNRFIFGLNNSSFEGRETLSDDLVFDGLTYPAGGDLRTDMDYDRRRLLYGRPAHDGRQMAVGYLVGLESYDIRTSLDMKGTGSRSVKLDSKVPVLGASLTYKPHAQFRIYGEVSGMVMERSGVSSRLLNSYASADYMLYNQLLWFTVGYRYNLLDASEDEESEFDLTQKGIFYGLVLTL